MPSADEHYNQYLHNMKMLNSDIFKGDEFADWLVTVLFYGAVHLVECEISKVHGMHAKNHDVRFGWVSRTEPLKNVCSEYSFLYFQSRRSRYECVKFSPGDLRIIKNNFTAIEKLLDSAE